MSKQLRLVYGFNIDYVDSQIDRAHVYLIGVNGETKHLCFFDVLTDDMSGKESDRSPAWTNTVLTRARIWAQKQGAFYGCKPERVEHNKVVTRSFNYKHLIGKK